MIAVGRAEEAEFWDCREEASLITVTSTTSYPESTGVWAKQKLEGLCGPSDLLLYTDPSHI